jgi:glutamate N-acetyltransferase/amino-acid N-acetyltransferase
MTGQAAKLLGIKRELVLAASTGVIGQFLPMKKIRKGIEKAVSVLLPRPYETPSDLSPLSAVWAIMTTDRVPKVAQKTIRMNGESYSIWGCSKGSGMIHPRMATMLSFLLTDAALPHGWMRGILKRAVETTFNRLSVDGDTSTNDCAFLLANGMSGCALSKRSEIDIFQEGLLQICGSLSRQMARDGEGATKVLEVSVKGARTSGDAKKVAGTVATSPLVKTAIFGEDANWGRIIAAAGRAGAGMDPGKIEIFFDHLPVARNGCALHYSQKEAKKIMKGNLVRVTIDLHQGRGESRYLTCDFSLDYVKINADYRT